MLRHSQNMDLALVGDEMGDLLASRKAADYDIRKLQPEQSGTAPTNVATARDLMERLTKVFSGPDAAAAVQAIREYAKLAGIAV